MATAAETLFSETHGRTIRAWSTVSTFRQVMQAGLAAAAKAKAEEAARLYDLVISDPYYMKLVNDVEGFRKAMPKDKFIELGVKQSTETATNLLNAATILFGHSMVDGAAFDYCRVTALHAPKDWEAELSNKQVVFSLLRECPIDEIRRLKLEDVLEDLEMKSLKEKINRLHARCQPDKGWSPIHGYVFDLARIERLDLFRQDIVHGNALGRPIPDVNGEFDYMNLTCWYLMGLVNMRYGLRLDPYVALGPKNEKA
jgi:hypothetical protein